MKARLFIVCLVALAMAWTWQRLEASALEAHVEALRQRKHNHERLRRERDRLRELAGTSATSAESSRRLSRWAGIPAGASATPIPAAPGTFATSLVLGEWRGADAWRNRGCASPIATLETALWAGAGGDVATLGKILLFPAEVHTRAEDLFRRLSPQARAVYGSADQLVAAFTAKSIPLTQAQLVWHHESGPDNATACMLVRNPSPASATIAARKENDPPAAPDGDELRASYLALRRTDVGWRIVVAPSAIAKIEAELGRAN